MSDGTGGEAGTGRTGRSGRTVSRWVGWTLIVFGVGTTAAMAVLAARGVEPVATWIYPFAWYPLLVAMEGGIALRRGHFLLLGRPALLVSVLAWSVPLWMMWEVINFRIDNWYYVFVPPDRGALWAGIVLSFATVLPACFLPAALVWPPSPRSTIDGGAAPEPSTAGGAPAALHQRHLRGIRVGGAIMLLLPLLWPTYFFPLVWGGFVLLVEPTLYRSMPHRSLLADLLRSRWDRIGSLLMGGALAGLAWESLNFVGRGRWIYTVPGLEELKLFEMPLLGFFGFPALAVSCFSLYQWLSWKGWAVPIALEPGDGGELDLDPPGAGPDIDSDVGPDVGRDAYPVWFVAAAFVLLTLAGIEGWTVSSRTPQLRDLPGLLPSDVEILAAWDVGSPFELAEEDPATLAASLPPSMTEDAVRAWVESARLATTRGMGTRHARILHGWGITSLEELARADPEELAARFASYEGEADVRPAQVRVWWRAAVDAVSR